MASRRSSPGLGCLTSRGRADLAEGCTGWHIGGEMEGIVMGICIPIWYAYVYIYEYIHICIYVYMRMINIYIYIHPYT